MRPSTYDSLELKLKKISSWITLFITNLNSLFNKLRGFLHGGRKILEGGTTFCWVYVQKFWSVIVVVFQLIPMNLTHSAFNMLLSSPLSTLSFGLMFYLGNRTGPKYWTSSQSLAHGNTKWNSFYLLWLPTENPALILSVWLVPSTSFLLAKASHCARSTRNTYNPLHVNWVDTANTKC